MYGKAQQAKLFVQQDSGIGVNGVVEQNGGHFGGEAFVDWSILHCVPAVC
jgi:hypothetical protein